MKKKEEQLKRSVSWNNINEVILILYNIICTTYIYVYKRKKVLNKKCKNENTKIHDKNEIFIISNRKSSPVSPSIKKKRQKW